MWAALRGHIIESVNNYTPATPSVDYDLLALILVFVGVAAAALTSGNTPWVVDLAGRLVSAGLTGA